MDELSLSNAQLAKACGVKAPTSFNWASGKTKNIKGEPLLRAAKTLQVSPEWLATGRGIKFLEGPNQLSNPLDRVSFLPDLQLDRMTLELIELFGQLDAESKREYLMHLQGFVAGRRPLEIGRNPAMAGKKAGSKP